MYMAPRFHWPRTSSICRTRTGAELARGSEWPIIFRRVVGRTGEHPKISLLSPVTSREVRQIKHGLLFDACIFDTGSSLDPCYPHSWAAEILSMRDKTVAFGCRCSAPSARRWRIFCRRSFGNPPSWWGILLGCATFRPFSFRKEVRKLFCKLPPRLTAQRGAAEREASCFGRVMYAAENAALPVQSNSSVPAVHSRPDALSGSWSWNPVAANVLRQGNLNTRGVTVAKGYCESPHPVVPGESRHIGLYTGSHSGATPAHSRTLPHAPGRCARAGLHIRHGCFGRSGEAGWPRQRPCLAQRRAVLERRA